MEAFALPCSIRTSNVMFFLGFDGTFVGHQDVLVILSALPSLQLQADEAFAWDKFGCMT